MEQTLEKPKNISEEEKQEKLANENKNNLEEQKKIADVFEKIKEELSDGKTQEYEREKRVLSEVNGHYERNFFGKSKVYLNIVENGQLRQSRTTYILTVKNKKSLAGTFTSTISDSSGRAKLTK